MEKLLVLLNDPSMQIFKRVCKILNKILSTSDHAKLICNQKLANALQVGSMPERDLQFLHNLIEFMYQQKMRYEVATRHNFKSFDEDNMDNQSKGMFANSFTALLTNMVQNYEIIFLGPHNKQWA